MKTSISLFLILIFLNGCVTREEIDVYLWVNNFNAVELKEACNNEPILWKIGFKRVLEDGRKELISICKPEAHDFFEMTKTDFNTLLDKALPKQPEAN